MLPGEEARDNSISTADDSNIHGHDLYMPPPASSKPTSDSYFRLRPSSRQLQLQHQHRTQATHVHSHMHTHTHTHAHTHTHTRRTPKSPLGTMSSTHHHLPTSPGTASDMMETWDYSETEWWGWIILIVTWLGFVIGIGSCFGVWSWAWDVGETPYAPPELEDDPTLPIVGYYPALITLTAVMSWVWVVVAWVGMKYFKHANISGDDT